MYRMILFLAGVYFGALIYALVALEKGYVVFTCTWQPQLSLCGGIGAAVLGLYYFFEWGAIRFVADPPFRRSTLLCDTAAFTGGVLSPFALQALLVALS
jgi:hypothetical protein